MDIAWRGAYSDVKQMEKATWRMNLARARSGLDFPDEGNIEDNAPPTEISTRVQCTVCGSMVVEIMKPVENEDLKQKNSVERQNPKTQDLVVEKTPNVKDCMTIDTSVRLPLSVPIALDDLKRECLYVLRISYHPSQAEQILPNECCGLLQPRGNATY